MRTWLYKKSAEHQLKHTISRLFHLVDVCREIEQKATEEGRPGEVLQPEGKRIEWQCKDLSKCIQGPVTVAQITSEVIAPFLSKLTEGELASRVLFESFHPDRLPTGEKESLNIDEVREVLQQVVNTMTQWENSAEFSGKRE